MKLLKWAALCLLAGMLLTAAAAISEQETLSGKLIRIHVIANSDSVADQQEKLRVRDAILDLCKNQNWSSREEAAAWISANTDELRNTARSASGEHSVQIEFHEESYPTRHYDAFSLPAGEYLSLQVKIGAAAGKNWWCVVYPSICTASQAEWTPSAASAGFSTSEIELMTGESKKVTIKFALLEWARSFKDFLQDT